MEANWSPWHGCHKYSEGCLNCYVYRRDTSVGRDASVVYRTRDFDLPLRRDRRGNYKLAPGTQVYTCFTSDFLVEEADVWRQEAFRMMRIRQDLSFFFITKRILRLRELLPEDWGKNGYPNVSVGCTCECARTAQERLPEFLRLPIARRTIICEPLLDPVDLSPYLGPGIAQVVAGGESGDGARVCEYSWVLSLREQCRAAGVDFYFKQTGARFSKDGKLYRIPRAQQSLQARKAGIDLPPRMQPKA